MDTVSQHILHYNTPGKDWFSALPLGNGRLGAMIHGTYPVERISLNQDSCYWGAPGNRIPEGAGKAFEKVRSLIMQGRVQEADDIFLSEMASSPRYSAPYVPLCEMTVRQWYKPELQEMKKYNRSLDLRSGIAQIDITLDGVRQERVSFTSLTHNVFVYRIKCDRPGGITFNTNIWRRPYDPGCVEIAKDRVAMSMQLGEGGLYMGAVMAAQAFGPNAGVRVSGDCLLAENAQEAVFYLAATTSFYDLNPILACELTLDDAMKTGFETLLLQHEAAFGKQYESTRLELSCSGTDEPMDERMKRYRSGEDDPTLEALFFNFGRYLLISSSQPGSQPANLQGIWNQQMAPPWDSNYTNNINLQMNYWAAEAVGLGELHKTVFDLVKRMIPAGRRAARQYYGCEGFVFHHNTDIFGDCAISSVNSAFAWVMGTAWILMGYWEHYAFTQDLKFLKQELVPLFMEAVRFYRDFLVEDGEGHLVTGFSQSPENACIDARTGQRSMTTDAAAMDAQLLRDLFTVTKKAMSDAGVFDTDLEQFLNIALKKLPPMKIGSRGQLLEWGDEYVELVPYQGHKSHLYAAYPSDQINHDTPELMEAVRKSLMLRTDPERKSGGWPAAWTAALYARLEDSESAYVNYRSILEQTHANLFSGHGDIFQIDANLGAVAAMTEMLFQSHSGILHPLPACPKQWSDGALLGVRARGGFVVDMWWENCCLKKLVITSQCGGTLRLRLPEGLKTLELRPGEVFTWN